jgi:anti-sigma28 factor (negative regulator of flagellin synthesis)
MKIKSDKIKAGLFGVRSVTESTTRKQTAATSQSDSFGTSDVHLSEDSSFVQAMREAARNQDASRAELIEQAKTDLANGLLGSDEDYEHAINALLQEL